MTGRDRFPVGASGGDVERVPPQGGRAVLSASCPGHGALRGPARAKRADDMGGEDGRARPALPPGRFVDLPGRGTTYIRELAGPDDAPAVLLLHGWTATADLNWHPSYRPLSNHFRVIAMDHRGHGRGLRGRFRLEDCADDAAMLLDQLEVDSCIAVGYSMGGPIAQLLHRRRPELVNGMVLCATSAAFTANARDHLLCGLATSGRFLARAIPMQPLGSVALGACRSWSTLMSGGWWGYEQVAASRLDPDHRGRPPDPAVRLAAMARDNRRAHGRDRDGQRRSRAARPPARVGSRHPWRHAAHRRRRPHRVHGRARLVRARAAGGVPGGRRRELQPRRQPSSPPSRGESSSLPARRTSRISQAGERRCGAAAASSEASRAACLRDEP